MTLTGLQPVFSASATYDPPTVISSTVTLTGLQPSFKATVLIGNILITISSGTTVAVGLQSRKVNILNLSREILL